MNKIANAELAKSIVSPIQGDNSEMPVTRKRSNTRVQNTEKARESFTEASILLENLKTALEGKMEVTAVVV